MRPMPLHRNSGRDRELVSSLEGHVQQENYPACLIRGLKIKWHSFPLADTCPEFLQESARFRNQIRIDEKWPAALDHRVHVPVQLIFFNTVRLDIMNGFFPECASSCFVL